MSPILLSPKSVSLICPKAVMSKLKPENIHLNVYYILEEELAKMGADIKQKQKSINKYYIKMNTTNRTITNQSVMHF